jgi:hypothetical protein
MKKSFVLAMIAAVTAAPAFAADNGFYIGANVGKATVSGVLTVTLQKNLIHPWACWAAIR